ncbi:MAG: hypothetical protein ABI983_09805, partial [Acidobacteriota bacterium]
MSFDDRIKSRVDEALGALVQQLLADAAAERDEAVRTATVAMSDQAEQAAQARVADAEARVRATLDEKIAQARGEDRESAAREIRKQLESEVDKKLHDALDAAENRHRIAIADGQAKSAEDIKAAAAAAHVKEREIEMSCAS